MASSESVEWWTPAVYVEAVRRVLGKIDLDPASCEEANKIVKAEDYYTIKHDGLQCRWDRHFAANAPARVFVNPPYGRRFGERGEFNQKLWTQKLIAECNCGNVSAAILLVNAATSEVWFRPLFDYPICFTRRIDFDGPNGKSGGTKGQAFVYFGPDKQLFAEAFAQFGPVVEQLARTPAAVAGQ